MMTSRMRGETARRRRRKGEMAMRRGKTTPKRRRGTATTTTRGEWHDTPTPSFFFFCNYTACT
jgi:hypothetical protein